MASRAVSGTLYLGKGGPLGTAAVSFGGADRLVSEYMESEFLERIAQRHRTFLTRTAVLERMCGPLCEAVLELPGSAATLADLARSNLLLVPLDRRGQWYRYHHLFRDMLLAELERLEPELMPALRRRAAGWCLRNDLPEEALEYSIAAGDVDTVARLAQSLWQVAGDLDLPEAGCLFSQPSRRPVPGAGSPGGVTAGLSCHRGMPLPPAGGRTSSRFSLPG